MKVNRTSVILVCVISMVPLSLHSAAAKSTAKSTDPYLEELKAKLRTTGKLPGATTPAAKAREDKPLAKPTPAKPISQAESKGTSQDMLNLFNEVQALLKQHKNVAWEGWKEKEYNRLGELRDLVAPKISPQFATVLKPYVDEVYTNVTGAQRDQLLKFVDALAPLFINETISDAERKNAQAAIGTMRMLAPAKTSTFAAMLQTIVDTKPATGVSAGKPGAKPTITIKPEAPKQPKVVPAPKGITSKPIPTNGNGKKMAAAKVALSEKCLADLRAYWRKELEQEWQELMKIFFEITGMQQNDFDAAVATTHAARDSDMRSDPAYVYAQPMSQKSRFYHLAHSALTSSGFNPHNFEILDNQNPYHPVSMATVGNAIIIDPAYLAALPDIQIEAILLHEIQHIVFKDPSVKGVVKGLLRKLKSTDSDLWDYFIEKRADILGGLTSIGHMKAFIDWLSALENQHSEDPEHQHPAQRAATLRVIYEQMLKCYE